MAKKYKFLGAKFTDPTIEIQSFKRDLLSGLTEVDAVIRDKDDSVSYTFIQLYF